MTSWCCTMRRSVCNAGASNAGCSPCVHISRERSYPLPIYWYHSKGNWLRYDFAADSFWATVCKTVRPMLLVHCPVCPVCDVRALWPNGWTDQDETCMQVGLRPGHSPQFSTHICCGQMAAWIKMSLGMELVLGPGDFVLDGDRASLPKKGAEPLKFLAHVYCGLDGWSWYLAWIGLSPGDFVLDGDPAPTSSLDWVLSHWAHFTVLRFIFVLCITVCCMHA